MHWSDGGGKICSRIGHLQSNAQDAGGLKSALCALQWLDFVLAIVWGCGLDTQLILLSLLV